MRLTLPSDQEAWVEIDPRRVTIGDSERLLNSVTKAITAWNLYGDSGEIVPITVEAVGFLSYSDIEYIASHIDTRVDDRLLKEVIVAVNNTDEDSKIPVPMPYVHYQYRRVMGISYKELMDTPLYIFHQDLKFIDIDNQSRRNYATTE